MNHWSELCFTNIIMILYCWSNEYIFYLSEPKRGVSFYSTMILERFLVFISELVWVLHSRQLIQENNLIRQTVPTVSITNNSSFDLGGKKTAHKLVCWITIILAVKKPSQLFTWILATHLPSSLFLSPSNSRNCSKEVTVGAKALLRKFQGLSQC